MSCHPKNAVNADDWKLLWLFQGKRVAVYAHALVTYSFELAVYLA